MTADVSPLAPLRFIDVSGVGNTGKSAAVDLLREIDGLWVPEYWFEFDFIRWPGGLLDLRHALLEDWSPVRSHDAWLRFRDLVRSMGLDPRPWQIGGLMESTSQRYDRRFAGRFVELSMAFADSFLAGTIQSEWPSHALRDGGLERMARKALWKTGIRRWFTRDVHLLDGSGFDARAAALLDALYRTIVPPETDIVVLNNGFEPFHPQPALDMLQGARQVVVTRDPRDIYVSGLNAHNVSAADASLIAFDNDGMNKSFLATDDLAMFVKRFQLYHAQLGPADPRVLRIGFEQITHDYEASVARVLAFLEVDPAQHVRPRTHLDPVKSGRNVGIWKSYSKRDEIAYIERELTPYLVDV
jgi:hypothetical protein